MAGTQGGLPQAIEDAVLAILEGEETARPTALKALLAENPQHETAIRHWLLASGVDLPVAPPQHKGTGTPSHDIVLPQRLGAYLLQAVLGRGGFGTVYRAEQQEPIRRPVAVKVLNPGMDSREVLSRFAAEREALNRMDHAGIARLLDAGTTPQGRPFFVMELVLGPTLLNHCRQEKLPLRERLQLFLHVLDAMQHAHQKAVLHRDLSSNNVLVADPQGRVQPKIIDFGIAKSLRDPLLQGGAMTFQGTLMGTPEFMSPEQASGRNADIDTRADVYALGVQLYELLTDQLPIPGVVLRSQGLAGMANVIQQHEPVLPSEACTGQRSSALRGDLDGIVMKAIAKSRDERYATVGDFAADLRHHLADEPVQVASPTTWYRLRKFVRRHRAQSVAAAIVGVGLLAALAVLVWALGIRTQESDELQDQKEKVEARADRFKLLANEELLRVAIAAAKALPPPWPEHAAAYAAWIAQHAEPLAKEQRRVQRSLETLAARPAQQPDDPADQHLEKALLSLQAELRTFLGDGGTLAEVLQKQQFMVALEPAVTAHEASWRAAIDAIKTSDGTTASAAYRGLQLTRMSGLVPLGCNPDTMLFEFLDLASHAKGHPLPGRDATGRVRVDAGTGVVFVLIPPGNVRMGAHRRDPGMPQNDDAAKDDELDGKLVILDAFLFARTELTEGQWARLARRPLGDRDALLPATGIDWDEAQQVLRGFDQQMPTEAQWEYACRAGTTTPWCAGPDWASVSSYGWFGPRPQPVGKLRPNAFGLFDMHGNVAEWCTDEKLPYVDFVPRAGDGLLSRPETPPDALRVLRGGACDDLDPEQASRSSARDARSPATRDGAIGLRPVRALRPRR
ncbi:MAG TPA: bifunctional serine/threonine-protein kinase/formylglycine-generating enzyme family protein [Planctomycetota bacterium]|nr:bifunctional serine/threonine-protein kinase/formylglycine-generating enzyme family protein [Planctomycetota bacterium]